MPRGDGTGPMGMGPMTGRGLGYCTGRAAPGNVNYGCGMGFGRGRGFRRMYGMTGLPGWVRNDAYPYGLPPNARPFPAIDEREALRNQAAFLEKQLNQVREQLGNLKETE